MRIVLVGMMGSGKSSVGRALAALTGWPFHDNDELLERATGRTARELASAGEAVLREAESAALRAGLALSPPSIVASAAGVVLDGEMRTLLASEGGVAWLRARPATLQQRLKNADDDHRPWLDRDPDAWLRQTDAERAPLFAAIADLVVDVDDLRPDAAASRILAAFGRT
ncbi:MAG: shikimate kinase [Chloroflexota bacterium]